MDQSSTELLKAVQSCDSGAATELFERYVPRLKALVQSRLSALMSRRIDSDDVVQSALRSFFVRATDGGFNAEQPGDLWRLLATITLRKLSRTAVHHKAAKRDIRRENAGEDSVSGVAEIAQRMPTPADAAAASEELVWLLRHISAKTGRALQLRLQGFEIQEIADQIECSERTVRRWLDDIRTMMQSRIEQFSHSETPKKELAGIDLCDGVSHDGIKTNLDPRDYVLQRLIGAGGVCKVYAATQRSTGHEYCVKVLRRQFRHQKRFVQRFLYRNKNRKQTFAPANCHNPRSRAIA
jgi:RNA polymerase sigma-70 factor (ECF subfamily)